MLQTSQQFKRHTLPHSGKASRTNDSLLLAGILAAGIGVLCCFLLLLLCTALTVGAKDPAAHLGLWGTVCLLAGAAGIGVTAGCLPQKSEQPIWKALIGAGIYVLLLTLLSLLLKEGALLTGLPHWALLSAGICGAALLAALPFRSSAKNANRSRRRMAQARRGYR